MLKYFLVIYGICCLLLTPAFTKHLHSEAEYQTVWCNKYNGVMEYKLSDKARVDCMATIDGVDYAVEVDFSQGAKVYECIGQSLYYALMTGRKAGALLILETKKDKFYLKRFKAVAEKYDIKYWTITPKELKNKD